MCGWPHQTAQGLVQVMQSYNECCRNATFPRRASIFKSSCAEAPFVRRCSAARAEDLDIQIADLLAQRIAIDAQKIGRPDLIAAGRSQRRCQQRHLDLTQDAMIEAWRRQAVGEP